jgi:tetratricopeptide (TPR) repeat protein
MLFDLKGKRRRAVQGTYLTLAILMGAGLVLFGIGSSTNGGLGDLFNGGGGSNKGNSLVQKQIDAAQKQLQVNPKNIAALGEVIRGHYQLATQNADPNTGVFAPKARGDLQQATIAWQRYLTTNPKNVDVGLARVMVQAYSGLAQLSTGNQAAANKYWAGAAGATEQITAEQPNPANYLALVQYATLAGQTGKADLAGNRAVQLAPTSQRKAIKQQVASAKAAGTSQGGGGTSAAPTTTAP